jgi:hypothetical protein
VHCADIEIQHVFPSASDGVAQRTVAGYRPVIVMIETRLNSATCHSAEHSQVSILKGLLS